MLDETDKCFKNPEDSIFLGPHRRDSFGFSTSDKFLSIIHWLWNTWICKCKLKDGELYHVCFLVTIQLVRSTSWNILSGVQKWSYHMGLVGGLFFCSFGYSWASFHKGVIICLCCHWYWGHSNKLLPVFLIIFLLYHGQLTSVSFVELPLYHNVTLTHLMSGYTSIGYKLTQLILIFRWKV